ncbi:flagellar brake protein [Desulfoscipio gibsoniae]|uniref:Putative glycosyltransferase n=1 Tax=Desulfoscipio gibsoniae DSM 7213 TaxID=767817 RepID=R4KGB7_9FIRM|nr:flagellar brake domain-containing protein [Desulfoscipio gibsoniae]AGL01639.1 putative glycosyltransferase [Desulfoscipio gibsoniae DSM 7213]
MPEELKLHINQKIQVAKENNDIWFNSIIQDTGMETISIAIPYNKERPLVLYQNEIIRVRVVAKNASFMFSTQVIGLVMDKIKLYQLAYPKEIIRIQQRKHFRLQVISMDVEYACQEDKSKYNKGTVIDISGGGMKLAVSKKIRKHERLLLKFNLPLQNKPELIQVKAIVVRSEKAEPDREIYHLGLKYENITYKEQDLIVRYIFERMAQQKRLC